MIDNALFVTSGTLDEAFFHENAKYMLTGRFNRKRLILAAAVTALCVGEALWFRNWAFMWILLAYWASYIPFTLWYRKSAAKTSIKRFQETYSQGKCELTTACTPEGVWTENHTSGGSGTIGYEHLHTMAVADHAYILLTKAGQYTVCFTDALSQQEKADLRAYLCEKAPKMKVIR